MSIFNFKNKFFASVLLFTMSVSLVGALPQTAYAVTCANNGSIPFSDNGAGQCIGAITSGTTFITPSDWSNTSNTIEVVGAGGSGAVGTVALSGGGGGGGAYAFANNVTVSGTVNIQIGVGGGGNGSGNATWFSSTGTVDANSGANASGITAGAGGTVVSGTGFAGGTGGSGTNTALTSGGGGGGAAGPGGKGGNGGGGPSTTTFGGSGGGGNGGGNFAAIATTTAGGLGAAGDFGTSTAPGGLGGNPGGNGLNGGGGGGGTSVSGNNTTGGTGGNGSQGSEWSIISIGTGGGGGGGGSNSKSTSGGGRNAGPGGSPNSTSGAYGGGGGGGGSGGVNGGGAGTGAQGVIVITYTPNASKPTVATNAADTITAAAANINGNVTSDNGATVTARGFATSSVSTLASSVSTSTLSGTTGAFSSTFSNTNLTGNTTYYFRAYATNSVGTSLGSILNFLTVPDVPGTATYSNTIATTTGVTWTAPTGGASTYKLEQCITGSNTCSLFTGITSNSTTTYSLTGNTNYEYAVRGTNATGDGVFSATSTPVLTLPNVPGTPTFTNISFTTLTINWTQSVGSSTSYKVERCTGTGCTNFVQIASGVGTTNYNDTGLSSGTTYRYRIRGTNATGDGLYSAGAEATTNVVTTVTISGTLYSDEGITAITSGKTIKASVNGAAPASATSDGSGNFSITINAPSLNNPIALWVGGDAATRAFTLVKATTTQSMGGVPLYKNRIVLLDQSTTTVTNADLAAYDNSSDSDIQFDVINGALTTFAGQKLYVAPRTTFAPGGAVTISGNAGASPDGDFSLSAGSVYFAGATTTIAGSLLASTSANFIANGFTTVFTASTTGKLISGPFVGYQSLGSTTFTGSGSWTMQSSLSASNLSINSGTLSSSNNLTIAGNYNNAGTFTAGSGTTTFAGKFAVGGVDATGAASAQLGNSAFNATFATTTNGVPYLYAVKASDATNCASPSHTGCELQIYDISSSTNPVYVGGADVSGTSGDNVGFSSIYVSGNYAYVTTTIADGTDCARTDTRVGCELQIYDVSNPAVPTFVAGVDNTGAINSGTGSFGTFHSVFVSGHFAYVANDGDNTDCGSSTTKQGCDLQVYDVSNPASPTFVGGADVSGLTNSGTGNLTLTFKSVFVSGTDAYLTTGGNSGTCSATPGLASGCELQVYDVSTPSAPTYLGGADSDGTTNGGTGGVQAFNSVFVSGNFAYVAAAASSTACTATPGVGSGCELKVFDIGVTGSPSAPKYVGGADAGGGQNTGTLSQAFNSVVVSGNFAYVGMTALTSACSATAGITNGCELKVFDISTPSTPLYVGGADDTGATNSGNGVQTAFNSVYVSGNTAYVATGASGIDCTNGGTSFGRVGCELQVYNVTTPSTPTLTAGIDATVNGGALGSSAFNGTFVQGNYLYAVKAGDTTDCANPTNHVGCELQVYDISAHGNPVYVGGADGGGGTNSGTSSIAFNAIYVVGNDAYVGAAGNSNNCSLSVAAINGCEFKIFDVSNPAAPTYLGGADNGGTTNTGTGGGANGFGSVFVSGNFAYLTVSGGSNSAACSTTPSSTNANGCNLKVFDITTPSAPNYVGGADSSGLTNSGTGSGSLFSSVFVSGNYAYVTTAASSTACTATAGAGNGCELKVFDIGVAGNTPATPLYVGGADASGATNASTTSSSFNSVVVSGNYAYVAKANSNVDCSLTNKIGCELQVYDIGTTPGTPTFVGGADANGTTNTGTGNLALSSVSVSGNDAYVTTSSLAQDCGTVGNKSGCELQAYDISIPASPTFVGGADRSGSINSGVQVGAFNSVFATGSYVYVAGGANAVDCAYTLGSKIGCELQVYYTGDLLNGTSTIAGNTTGSSAFNNFTISAGGKVAAPSSLEIAGNYTNSGTFGASSIGTTTFSGTNVNLSGTLSGASALGNVVISGSGTTTLFSSASTTNLTINTGAKVAFGGIVSASNTFTVGPSVYVQFLANATSTFQNISWAGSAGSLITLRSSIGGTQWGLNVPGNSTVNYADVQDSNTCSGGANISATNTTDSGNNTCWTFSGSGIVIVTGGGTSGGSDLGGNAPVEAPVGGGNEGGGQTIGNDPGFFAPSSNASVGSWASWKNPQNAYASDNVYATTTVAAATDFYTFGFNIPAGDTITGIAVKIEASASTNAGTIPVELSWNSGTATTTSGFATGVLGVSDTPYTLGSTTSLWGHAWIPSEFADGTFRVRIFTLGPANQLKIDAIQVNVFHQATGGGSGGGGDI